MLPSFETASLCVCVVCIYPASSRREGRKSDEYTKNRKNREQSCKGKGTRGRLVENTEYVFCDITTRQVSDNRNNKITNDMFSHSLKYFKLCMSRAFFPPEVKLAFLSFSARSSSFSSSE